MLTPEQETARAVKASKLYGQPLPSEIAKKRIPRFIWRPALLAGIALPLPFLFLGIVIDFSLFSHRADQADFQAASILVIVLLLFVLAVLIICVRFFRQTLSDSYLCGRVGFWATLLGVLLISYMVFKATQPGDDIGLAIGLYSAILLPLTYVWTVGTIYGFDRLARR